MLRAVCLGVFLTVGESAKAQSVTGNDLFEACESDGLPQAGYCIDYIIGAVGRMRRGVALPMFRAGQTDVAEVNEMSNFVL